MVDVSPESLQQYIGRPAEELPTPAFVLSKPTVERNCQRLHDDVRRLGIGFRPHVKTLKSEEVIRLMLGGAKGCVASTLREIRGLLPLAREGLLEEVLYGVPIRPSALPALQEISKTIKTLLMVDNITQIDAVEAFSAANSVAHPWHIFIKVDIGAEDRRAGITPTSPRLADLIARAIASPAITIDGFYAHAGHSYDARSVAAAAEVLHAECDAAVSAAAQLPASMSDTPITISFGATPTAHVVGQLKQKLPPHLRLELHAGNFVANDLQQLGTGCIEAGDMAVRVLAEVCSIYPERNEALVNAGVIALGREPGPIPGYGRVEGAEEWIVGKVSQEHGILRPVEGAKMKAEESFAVGQKVFLYVQHACIAAAAHFVYFVVDEKDVVREIWQPWKGW
ncbi:uncharacterized protein K452DRAFT_35730 [Aplosporella prunicola CBS 121167]|uniref:D-serine dehydratase n=1 Tax=Aplosporella prunicola CBS 121167 TaxID=1176127 RepID=A0A6A6AXI3_9PEZI|nr:uncharacterized protein K452DRAFT_35730 [Aplosporella prunicola CBS 121167]KAF2135271.1 hypothetical protein K452DRAFT_35730 [Aplosporella prunicola CBS 121167]